MAVVVGVAPEAQGPAQVRSEGIDVRARTARGQLVEALELGIDVEVAPGVGGDQQGPQIELASLLRTAHQFGEPVGDVHFESGYRRLRRVPPRDGP